jgi:hypothetical protein
MNLIQTPNVCVYTHIIVIKNKKNKYILMAICKYIVYTY